MKENGFTLIELLAVIVILAIIALIATPIVLDIIKDSKDQARRRSLEMYIDGVNNAVAQYQLKAGNQPDNFENIKEYIQMDNSNVSCDGGNFKNGQIPLQNCKVDNETVIEDYIYGNVCVAVNENTATYRTDDTSKTVGYVASNVPSTAPLYNEKEPQYTPGVEYICEVKKGTYYRFYVLNTEGDNVNLIMDSGISADGKAVKTVEMENITTDWGIEESESVYGPTKALDHLYNATKDWANIININIDYVDEGGQYGGVKTENNITSITKLDGEVTASFTNLKSRLPKKIELANLGCNINTKSCPLYLYNYMDSSDNCGGINIDNIYSQNTMSSSQSGYCSLVWTGYMHCKNSDAHYYQFFDGEVRPVITLQKKLLSY